MRLDRVRKFQILSTIQSSFVNTSGRASVIIRRREREIRIFTLTSSNFCISPPLLKLEMKYAWFSTAEQLRWSLIKSIARNRLWSLKCLFEWGASISSSRTSRNLISTEDWTFLRLSQNSCVEHTHIHNQIVLCRPWTWTWDIVAGTSRRHISRRWHGSLPFRAVVSQSLPLITTVEPV